MRKLGNAVWLTAVIAGAVWFLLAFTVIGFPLVVAAVAIAAVWMLVELVLAYRTSRAS